MQRENNQYQNQINEYDSKNKKFETIICEKNKEMIKLLKKQEQDKSQIKILIKENETHKNDIKIMEFITKDFMEHCKVEDYASRTTHADEVDKRRRKFTPRYPGTEGEEKNEVNRNQSRCKR